jgi:hypothetical protein
MTAVAAQYFHMPNPRYSPPEKDEEIQLAGEEGHEGEDDDARSLQDRPCLNEHLRSTNDIPPQFLERCTEPESEPDVLVGAYMLDHITAKCEQCGTAETPQWRKGWDSSITHRAVNLCNACGLKWAKKQFCPYCRYIYRRDQDKYSVNKWVGCVSCPRYVHVECERAAGFEVVSSVPYRCPECRTSPLYWQMF